MNNLDPAGKLFSSATAQPFLFACVLFQTKRHWGDKRLKSLPSNHPKVSSFAVDGDETKKC